MHSLGRNNLIGYCLAPNSKLDVRIDHLFPQTPTVIVASDASRDDNVNMAIADSLGNSISVNCHNLGELAIAMDGRLANQDQLYREILTKNMVLLNKSSEELVAYLLAEIASEEKSLPCLIKKFISKYPGGYCLVIMNKERIYAARDCYGIKPLVIGRLDDCRDVIEYDLVDDQQVVKTRQPNLIASTSVILENMSAKYIRQVHPGEIVELSTNGIKSMGICYRQSGDASSFCAMEYVMMESPFSFLQEQRVYDVRYRLGQAVSRDGCIVSDGCMTLPNVSLAYVLGYSKESGIGIIEAFYYSMSAVNPKCLSLYSENVIDKVLTLVVDSVINDELIAALNLLRNSSVKEIHLLVCSPQIVSSCPFGIDVTVDSASIHDVTSIQYLDLESFRGILRRKIPSNEVRNVGHCFNCFGACHGMFKF